MQPFHKHHGLVVPLLQSNLDTDRIIPKQFLKSIQRTGFGANLFDDMRYHDSGELGQDPRQRRPKKDFVLNQPRYRGASILLTGVNFGCGSSREHAVWALMDFGIQVVIAPSFADIFFINCGKNGLLTVELPEEIILSLAKRTAAEMGYSLTVDLPKQEVITSLGVSHAFTIDAFRKNAFMKGLDDIGVTMEFSARIKDYEKGHKQRFPWLFNLKNYD